MKRKSPLNRLSKKRSAEKKTYKEAWTKQDLRTLEDNEGVIPCSSCGVTVAVRTHAREYKTVIPWGHSHNMSVKHYQDLESDPNNFKPRCQDFGFHKGCHEALDYPDFSRIKNFIDLDQIMEYRKEHSIEEYNKFVSGLKAAGCDDYDYIGHEDNC